jgi:small-conductance mechanosensitive channel
MKAFRSALIVVPAVLLAVFLGASFWTRSAMQQLAFLRSGGSVGELVDQRPWQTIQALAPLAVSAEEQSLAQDATKLADHEVDQAFAFALRGGGMQTHPLSPEAVELQGKVTALQQTLADDKAHVDTLTAAAKASGVASVDGDELDIARAQMGLDQDELTDATGDLARASGDQRGKIQQELQVREEAAKKYEATQAADRGQVAVLSAKRYATLWGRTVAWFDQRSRVKLIAQAEAEARQDATTLMKQHDALEAKLNLPGTSAATGTARAKMLRRMSSQRAMMSILDDRVQGNLQLAALYQRWQAQVWLQHRIVGHLLLNSLAAVVFLILMAVLADRAGSLLILHMGGDRRRVRTLETILHLAVQVTALLAILLVFFGVPDQMPTILGLATAGLTVVFQDFILAFFGWFVLMGKNGLRVGDWVEISGVGGEVVEIGLFRTALLETGNWTSQGHPTGRRVTFINSFAIRGQYFNFTTTGQWMWDEIKINIPAGAQSYAKIEEINHAVQEQMQDATEGAELEWQRASQKNGLSQFNAIPTVDMRPASSGVDVIIRYVTRASERYEVANRLNQTLLNLLAGQEPAAGVHTPS